MNPIRRESLNGLLVLVVASLLSVAFSAFQVSFDVHLWVLILMAVAIAVSGYLVFEFVLSADEREKEWLKRVGTPARLEFEPGAAFAAVAEAVEAMKLGSDYTNLFYYGVDGGRELHATTRSGFREKLYSSILEYVRNGKIREYKRIICFDNEVLANDHELRSGVLRVGEGPGTIDRVMGEHGRVMLETKGCSLYVAPAVLRFNVALYGADKVSVSIDTAAQDTGVRATAGLIFFCDPPNGEILEQFRQMERATEKRMVAVHKIRFPEDAEPTVDLAAR